MLKNKTFYNKDTKNLNLGFTLIEILVVVAIIGVLSTIVLVSINTARERAKIANIKSNLKNAIGQAELSYFKNNSYSGACDEIAPMLLSIEDRGDVATCYSVNNPTWGDVHTRWGATAFLSETNNTDEPLEAYSVSELGVVKWYAQGVTTFGVFNTPGQPTTWASANNACSLAKGRLPTIEELKSLSDASLEKTGFPYPSGFATIRGYWSSTTALNDSNSAYYLDASTGNIGIIAKNTNPITSKYTFCVHY